MNKGQHARSHFDRSGGSPQVAEETFWRGDGHIAEQVANGKRFGTVGGPIAPFAAVFLSDGRTTSVIRKPKVA